MAHKKAGGSSAWGRDSHGQRLGIKLTEGSNANPGSILIRQRGTKYVPGANVKRAGDDTLYALCAGFVHFTRKSIKKFDGNLVRKTVVHVLGEKQKGGGVGMIA